MKIELKELYENGYQLAREQGIATANEFYLTFYYFDVEECQMKYKYDTVQEFKENFKKFKKRCF